MITILCLAALITGIVLCAVLAEPWQRTRYDELAASARRRLNEFRLDDFDEIDAAIARELHREASGE